MKWLGYRFSGFPFLSEETGNCLSDPEIEELLVGRCCQCGQLWCTECDRLLERDSPSCECWEEE